MADPKHRTPDILSSVLSTPASTPVPASVEAPGSTEATTKRKPVEQQDGKTANHNTGKTLRQQDGKTAGRQNGKIVSRQYSAPQAEADKVKATFYLAADAVEGLEDAWLQLRRQARGASRKRAISKSEIVEMALQIMLEDLEAHGEASRISGKLLAEPAKFKV